MEIIYFDDIPSSSLIAAEKLKSGQVPPFAIIAGQQSGGRGRRGRTWVSPPGGIYLSVALPAPEVESALLGNLPLWIGVKAAQWLQRKFNLRISLKWPNDLMFDGRKLGGILVESGIEGGKQAPVIVGIGINCHRVPVIKDVSTAPHALRPIALADICDRELDPKELARDLSECLAGAWASLSPAGVGEEFLSWCPPGLRLWMNEEKSQFWRVESIAVDGSLQLERLGPVKSGCSLHSVDHQLHANSRSNTVPTFIADVGNTSVKIHVLDSLWSDHTLEQIRLFYDDKSDSLRELFVRLFKHAPCAGWPFWIAGVAPARMDELFRIASQSGFLPQLVEKRYTRRHGDGYPLQELGIDRLAAIEGWLTSSVLHKRVAVIASFGTALTVDVVQGDGKHLGGVIAPGLTLGGHALHEHTGLLPLVEGKALQDVRILGHSTRSAIGSGLVGAAIGLVERIARDVLASEQVQDQDLSIVFCGGDRVIAAAHFPRAEVADDLLLNGLKSMLGGGFLPESPKKHPV